MKLEGRLFIANLLIKVETIEQQDSQERWVRQLENCLVELCRRLEVPLPLWLEKNTHEFARFHQTLFFGDQFIETIRFDRMQIRLLG
jgi:hypothetical protein